MYCKMMAGLYLDATGAVHCWCSGGIVRILGETRGADVAEFYHSDVMVKMRKSFVDGVLPWPECAKCAKKDLDDDHPIDIYPDVIDLHFEPSAACNLRCETCPGTAWRNGEWVQPKPERLYYPLEEFKQMIDGLLAKGIRLGKFGMVGLGEPLLNPELPEMIAYAKEKFPSCRANIDTNGAVKKVNAAVLVKSGLDQIRFGIDGATQASYEKYRIGGDVSRAFTLMEQMVEERERQRSNIQIIWKYILFSHNDSFDELEAASERAKRLGVPIQFETGWTNTPFTHRDPAEVNYFMEKYGWTYRIKPRIRNTTEGAMISKIATLKNKALQLESEGMLEAALSQYLRAAEMDSNNVNYWLQIARLYKKTGKFREAAEAYQAVLELDPNNSKAQLGAGSMLRHLGRFDQAERYLKSALLAMPDDIVVLRNLAFTLAEQGKSTEATVIIERVRVLRPIHDEKDQEFFKKIDKLMAHGSSPRSRPGAARYPRHLSLFDNFDKVVKDYVINQYANVSPIIHRETRVVTLGSCFARSVAQVLEKRAVDVSWVSLSEEVNSTTTNKYMLRYVAGAPREDIPESIVGLMENKLEEIRAKLAGADVLIYTLGVAPGFFDRNTGLPTVAAGNALQLRRQNASIEFRTTTVEENLRNFVEIVDIVRSIRPGIKVVYTLSPVPLIASFEMDSAVVADCISKSILRVTCHEISRLNLPDLYYWPSFEIVRWLGAHTGPVLGTDGNTHHVDPGLVECIISNFLSVMSDID